MAAPSAQTLQRLADKTGHQAGTLEKVLRLLDLLQEIARDRVLADRLVLKGGTALNLFHSRSRPALGRYRPELCRCARPWPRWKPNAPTLTLRSTVSSRPRDTAFAAGLTSMPVASGWPATSRRSAATPRWRSTSTTWRASHCSARRAWSLFPWAACGRRTFSSSTSTRLSPASLSRSSTGMLPAIFSTRGVSFPSTGSTGTGSRPPCWPWGPAGDATGAQGRSTPSRAIRVNFARSSQSACRATVFTAGGEVDAWIEETVALCRERFAFLFDLTVDERAFLDGVLDRGEIDADLLDIAPEIGVRIEAMPMLAWKTRHVREHRGLDAQKADR